MSWHKVAHVEERDIERLIKRDFPDENCEHVMKVLRAYREDGRISPRVYAAAIKLSGGNIEELKQQIERAKFDFRDVLSGAEYPTGMTTQFNLRKKMSSEEEEQCSEKDWQEYQEWFHRI